LFHEPCAGRPEFSSGTHSLDARVRAGLEPAFGLGGRVETIPPHRTGSRLFTCASYADTRSSPIACYQAAHFCPVRP
jgi:hypothetical protein